MGIVGDFVESLRGFCVNFVGILRKFGSDCVGSFKRIVGDLV